MCEGGDEIDKGEDDNPNEEQEGQEQKKVLGRL